ncbi:MAG TPA: hypothetical protein DCL77_16405 [Prolixibacteraceae bacterium]|jgi:hypothetical protein|nr:hypothetical protein [Prolixibacteraceae bacterium]
MENQEISSYPELVLHIMHLKQEKFRQEEEIKYTIRELIFLLNPVSMLKKGIREIAMDSEAKFDLAKVSMDLAITMLINGLMRNTGGLKGLLGKLLIGKFSSSFLYNNISKVVAGIRNRIRPTPHEIHQQ